MESKGRLGIPYLVLPGDPRIPCAVCREEIPNSAKVCGHCRSHQNRWLRHIPSLNILLSFGLLFLAMAQLYLAHETNAEAREALIKATASVEKSEAATIEAYAASSRADEGIHNAGVATRDAQRAATTANLASNEAEFASAAADSASKDALEAKRNLMKLQRDLEAKIKEIGATIKYTEEKTKIMINISDMLSNLINVNNQIYHGLFFSKPIPGHLTQDQANYTAAIKSKIAKLESRH